MKLCFLFSIFFHTRVHTTLCPLKIIALSLVLCIYINDYKMQCAVVKSHAKINEDLIICGEGIPN